MALKLFNTLTKKKEIFKPLKRGFVGVYTCGPTVYSYQHIGNLRSYIFADTLKRALLYNGYKVKHVMNITDVGHLTSDADTGEDKIEKAAQKERKTAKEITEYYWKIFKQDLKKLNIIEPNIWCKATEHIEEQIELIKKLERNGFTYKTSDGIYFDTSKFKNYGELANLKKQKLQAGKRIDLGEKKNINDFALWKFSEKPGLRQQEWESPWGIGFPGWHIECSAMSMKYLGERFDIHAGGIDHIPIHHTNEIAQNEGATGHRVVNFWIHGAFLTFKGEKISKKSGGLYTLSELEEMGFKPMAFRYLVLNAHYRSPLEFSLDALKGAQDGYVRLENIISDLKDDQKINKNYLKKFEATINDDLNTPKALSVMWLMLRDKTAEGKLNAFQKMREVFGFMLPIPYRADILDEIKLSDEIKLLVAGREKFRKQKNFQKADEIRKKLASLGYRIEDTKEGPRLKKI